MGTTPTRPGLQTAKQHVCSRPQWCSGVQWRPCSTCRSSCWLQSSLDVHNGCLRGQQYQCTAHTSAIYLACSRSSSRTDNYDRPYSQHRPCRQHRWPAGIQHVHRRHCWGEWQQGHGVSRRPLSPAAILLQPLDATGVIFWSYEWQQQCHHLLGKLMVWS